MARWSWQFLVALLTSTACASEAPPTVESRPAAEPASQEPGPPASPVEPEPTPEPPPPAFVPGPPTRDELLLLPASGCGPTAGASLGHCLQRWVGLHRGPEDPRFVGCEVALPEELEPRSRLLVRGILKVEDDEDSRWRRRCILVEVASTLTPEVHGIQPFCAEHFAHLDLGFTPEEQAAHVELGDLDRGPIRVFWGLDTQRSRVASAYLRDLGPSFAIPGHPLLTRDELRAALDRRLREGWRTRWVGGAGEFAPQIETQAERRGYAFTPVISLAPDEGEIGTYPWYHASAVPLAAGDGRRWLIMSAPWVRDSYEAALRRGRMIERIVEDDLHPLPADERGAHE